VKPVEIAENLSVSSHPFLEWDGEEWPPFDVVVNLSFRQSKPASQSQLVIWSPIRDEDEVPATVPMLATCIKSLATSGYRVLVHCDQGLNRAPFLAALAADRTVTQMRSLIPGCLTNLAFANHLDREHAPT
jgi:hypothetical protein